VERKGRKERRARRRRESRGSYECGLDLSRLPFGECDWVGRCEMWHGTYVEREVALQSASHLGRTQYDTFSN